MHNSSVMHKNARLLPALFVARSLTSVSKIPLTCMKSPNKDDKNAKAIATFNVYNIKAVMKKVCRTLVNYIQ